MIPLIQKEAAEKKAWVSEEDILNVVAIAESTPGPIAINMATFIGYKVCGVVGAFFATLGVVLPSFLIISVVAHLLDQFKEYKAVEYAFYGIRAGVLALVIKALVSMYKKMPKNGFSYALAILAFLAAAFVGVNVLFIIVACAIIGLCKVLIGKQVHDQ